MKKPTALNYLLENAKRRRVTYLTIAVMSIFAVLTVFVMAERPGITLTEDVLENQSPKQAAPVEKKSDNEIMPLAETVYPVVELDEENNCKYTFNNDNSLVIEPIDASIGECIVTPLSHRNFEEVAEVASIRFKNGITKIQSTESDSFASVCKDSLSNIDFSKCTTITDLGKYSFYECAKLVDIIDISKCSNLKAIPDYCFCGLVESKGVKLPRSIEIIGKHAFAIETTSSGRYGNSFTYVNFNELENLKIIDEFAFQYQCGALKEIDLTGCKNLVSINKQAFEPSGYYTKTEKINLSGLDKLTTIQSSAFGYHRACSEVDLSGCSSLKNITSRAFQYLADTQSNPIKVDSCRVSFEGCNSLTAMPSGILSNAKHIETIILSDTMTSIGGSAFYNFDSLKNIDLKNVKTIDSSAFYGCKSLEDIDLKNVTTINSSAFYGCTSLETVDLKNVTTLGSKAFYGCTHLKDISSLNKSTTLTKINDNTFYNTGIEELDINMPNVTLGNGVFSECKKLSVVNYTSLKDAGKDTFLNSGINKGITVNIKKDAERVVDNLFNSGIKIKEINFEGPNDSLILGENSFADFDGVIASLCDGTTEYSVDEYGCLYSKDKSVLYYVPNNLTEYTVPATVTRIANHAFKEAKKLTTLTVENPKAVNLDDYAFTGCKSLNNINGKTTYLEAKELFMDEGKTVPYTAFLQTGFEINTEYSQKNEYVNGKLINETKIEGTEDTEYKITLSLDESTKGTILDSANRFNSIDNSEEKNNVVPTTHYYLTNEKAKLSFQVDARGARENKIARIYLEADTDNIKIDSFKVGETTEVTNEGTSYKVTLNKVGGSNLYYFEFELQHGGTFAADIQMFYMNMSGSPSIRLWSQIIDKDDFDKVQVDNAPVGDALNAQWYTAARKFDVKKSTVSNGNNLGFKYVEKDGSGSVRFNKDLKYTISDIRSSIASADKNGFGNDFVEYMDYEDTLTLPDGVDWEDFIIKGIQDNKVYVRNNSIYLDSLKIATLSCGTSNHSLSNVKIKADTSGEKPKVTISWRINNLIVDTPKRDSGKNIVDYGTEYASSVSTALTFNAMEVFKIADDYDFSKNHYIPNDVIQYPNYIYADKDNDIYPKELFKQEANVQSKINIANPIINFKKEFRNYGKNGASSSYLYGGERIDFNIRAENTGILPYPVSRIEDTMPNVFMITPDKMDEMFADKEVGKLLNIKIINGYVDESHPNYSVIDTKGKTIKLDTIDRGNESTLIKDIDIKWVDDVLTVSTSDEVTYKVGKDQEYKSLKDLFAKIGFIDKNTTQYKCIWSYPPDKDGNVKKFIPNEKQQFFIPAEVKTTFERIDKDMLQYIYNQTTKDYEDVASNSAYLYSDDTDKSKASSSTSGFRWYYDYQISKSLRYNGDLIDGNNSNLLTANAIVDYNLYFSHRGNSVENTVPLNDVMSGNQALLVPVSGNSDLEELNLEKVQSNNEEFYLLDKPGTYKNVRIGKSDGRNIYADRIEVSGKKPSITTKIYWYFNKIDGSESHTIIYKAKLLDLNSEDTSSSGFSISNTDYLNERQGDRLYDSIGFYARNLYFEKNIVKIDDEGNEVLLSKSEIGEGESVLYKIRVVNNSSGGNSINDIRDELPNTFGTFEWNEDNISVKYVSSLHYPNQGITPNTEPKLDRSEDVWRVTDTPKDGGEKIEGQYYIYWDKDGKDQSRIELEPYEILDIYVTLTYPPAGDAWNNFMVKALQYQDNGSAGNEDIVSNTCRAGSQNSVVTHSVKTTGEVTLQKGVYDTYYGSSGSIYASPMLSRNAYVNSLNNSKYVMYYVTLYNSGYSRMYLTDLYDILPKGFDFSGLASINSSSQVNYSSITTYGINKSSNQNATYLKNLFALVEDNNTHQPVNYKSVRVTSSGGTNGKQLKFSFSSASSGNNRISYDSAERKCYLQKGEAIVFGYYVKIGKSTETEDLALNSIAMKYYDYNQAGCKKSQNINIYGNYTGQQSDTNDGKQNLLTYEEAGNAGYNNDAVKGSDWLESNVSLTRGKIIPGVEKTIKKEYTSNNQTIDIDGVNGTAVQPTSSVEWELKFHNSGGRNIEGYKITETMEGPYTFDGDMKFSVYDPKSNTTTGVSSFITNFKYNIDNSEEHQDTVTFSIDAVEYTVPVNMERVVDGNCLVLTDYSEDCTFSWASRSDKFNIKFTRKLNSSKTSNTGDLIMEITFDKESYAGIPANGGYSKLTLNTKNPLSGYSFKNYVNGVKLTPDDNFDPLSVNLGATADEGKSVTASGFFTIAGSWATESYKTVTAMNVYGEELKATSAHSNIAPNFITIDYDRETDTYRPFEYGLDVTNRCTGKKINKMIIIDNLPEPGDHSAYAEGVLRESAFKVVLRNTTDFAVSIKGEESTSKEQILNNPPENDKLGYTIQFTTSTKFDDNDWSGETGIAKWYTAEQVANGVDGITLDDIRSFRVVISGGEGIAPNETIKVTVPSKIFGVPPAYLIAWNNFGYKYYAEGDDTGMEKVLSASTLNVGIRTAAVPKMKKVLKVNSGHEISAEEYKMTATFLVYKGEKISYTDDQDLLKQLREKDIPFTIQTIDGKDIDAQKEIEMMKMFEYEVVPAEDGELTYRIKQVDKYNSDGDIVKADKKWTWEEDKNYTFTEISLPDNVKFTLYVDNNGTTIKSNSMTINFKRAGYYSMVCENTYNDYELDIEKTSSKTQQALGGAMFARYGVLDAEPGSDEYNEICKNSIKTYENIVEELSKEKYETNCKLEFLSKSKLDVNEIDSATKTIKDLYGGSKVLDIGDTFYPIYVVENGDKQVVYYLMDYDTTNKDGKIIYKNQITEEFAFVEVLAPVGYETANKLHIVLREEDSSKETLRVSDVPIKELPSTGGSGYLIYLLGAVFTLFPIIIIINNAKKKKGEC